MRTLTIASILLAGLCTASCLDLPAVDAGTCGNKIIDSNEDCDGDASVPEGTTCRAAGSVGACRFDCGTGSKCPTGYVCGGDEICRAHSGAFADVGTSVPVSPTHLLVDDFDGDGRSDVLAYDYFANEAQALFFEPSGALAKSVSLASDSMVPAAGKLATNAPSTFTFATSAGLGVMRGQTDRSFSPTPYSSIQLPWSDGRVLALEAMLPGTDLDPNDPYGARWLGDESVIFSGASAYVVEDVDIQPDKIDKSTLRLPRDQEPKGPIRVGDVDSDPVESPCLEMVLTYGDDKVYVVTPCIRVGAKLVWNRKLGPGSDPVKTYPPVTLFDGSKTPVSANIKSVFLTHLNAPPAGKPPGPGEDQHLDLLVNTWDEINYQSRVFAAFGDGTGHFAGPVSATEVIPNGAVEIATRKDGKPLLAGDLLLAVDDLDQDGRPDFVLPSGILMSRADGNYELAGAPTRTYWTDAAIADFNGDGRPDVICGSSYDVGIDFFTNAGGGALNPLVIPTEESATGFVVGDFDGDLSPDVAFRLGSLNQGGGSVSTQGGPEPPVGESDVPDSLGVIFGRFGQPPEAPRNLGQLSRIDTIVTGRTLVAEQPSDGISDLGVVSSSLGDNPVRSVAIFQGRGDRLLQSPFGLNVPGADPFSAKTLVATTIGHFDDTDGTSHLDIVALVQEEAFKADPGGTVTDTTPGATRYVLWLLPSTGTASLDITTAKSFVLEADAFSKIDWSTTQMATIDINGDGQDEVALVNSYSDELQENYVVAVSVVQRGGDGAPEIVGPIVLSEERFYGGGGIGGGDGKGDRNARFFYTARPSLCVADVDGDTKPDLVTFGADSSYTPRVVILWNTGDKASPFAAEPGHVTLANGDFISGYACVNLDRDPASELVLITSGGAYSVDFEAGVASDPARLEGVLPGTAVASGDFDGDGIADLVVSTYADTRLYRGTPVLQ